MEDKNIVCVQCKKTFTLTVQDQQWYKDKGFTEPKRCKSCRAINRTNISERGGNYNGKKKTKHTRGQSRRRF